MDYVSKMNNVLSLGRIEKYKRNYFKHIRQLLNDFFNKDLYFNKKINWDSINIKKIRNIIRFLNKKNEDLDYMIKIIDYKKNEQNKSQIMIPSKLEDLNSRTDSYKEIIIKTKDEIQSIKIYLEEIIENIENGNKKGLKNKIEELIEFLEKWSDLTEKEKAIQKTTTKFLFITIILTVLGGLISAIVLPLKYAESNHHLSKHLLKKHYH